MRSFPIYPRKSHASGQARIRWQNKEIYLGKWGSPESREAYARLFLAHSSNHSETPNSSNLPPKNLTVADLVKHFQAVAPLSHSPKEVRHLARVCEVLTATCGPIQASQFDAQALGMVRDAMIAAGWCRNVVTHQAGRLRSIWRWAESQRLVPPGSWSALRALPPLRRGSVRVTKPRAPATWEQVQAVMPHVAPAVQVMLEVQWWTGMRPGELVKMRPGDISKGETWLYRLASHKNDWRPGREDESVVLGPEAQRVLGPWLAAAERRGNDWLFPTSKRRGCPHYTVAAYSRAVARACKVARIVAFTPYSLRHSCKQRITRSHGLDAARAVLRQSCLSTTDRYAAGGDLELAMATQQKAG